MIAKKRLIKEIEILESSIITNKLIILTYRSILQETEDNDQYLRISRRIIDYQEDIRAEREQIKKLQKDLENLAA